MEGPHPHSVSTRTTDARWRRGPRKGLESRGGPWRRRCENRLDGSAACSPHNPPIFTSRLQPGAQKMSPPQSGTAGLRGFRAICRSRPIFVVDASGSVSLVDATCVASARFLLPTAATTTTVGLGVRVDPDWVACSPTRPAFHMG